MIRQAEREALISEIYSAVDQPDHLDQLLKNVAQQCDASCGSFLSTTAEFGSPQIMATFNHDPVAVETYNEHYKHIDAPAQFAQSAPLKLLHTSQLFKEHPETRRDDFEETFIARFPYLYHRVGFAFESQGESLIFAIHRSQSEGDFPHIEKTFELLNFLKPHIVKSSQLSHRIQQKNSLLETLINMKQQDDSSVIYFEGGNRCVFASENISQILQPFGTKLRWSGKELVYLDPVLKRRAEQILEKASSPLASTQSSELDESIYLWLPHTQQGLRLRYVRVTRNSYGLDKGILVSLGLLNRRIPEAPVIQATYGLTAAETRLTIGILMGDSASDYANRHELSVATVRAQIRAIFNKVGVARQADLIRHLMNLY